MTELAPHSELIIDAKTIDAAFVRMATEINDDFANRSVVMLTVMNGGMIPASLLAAKLTCDLTMDFIQVSRYRDETASDSIQWKREPELPLVDQHVLIVDDILDEGATLLEIIRFCQAQSARSVTTAVLVDKQHDRRVDGYVADYTGLQVDDRYIYGMGMDYRGRLRHLPEIYAINEH